MQRKQSTVAIDTQSQVLYNFQETSQVEFTRGIKCYSSRGISNNYNKCYANASFQVILGLSVFDLLPLKREQETDIKTKLLNLHDALTIENSPLDFEFHLHGSKVRKQAHKRYPWQFQLRK